MKMPWEQDREWNNTVVTNAPENSWGVIATESGLNYNMQKDQPTFIADLINRVASLEEDMKFVLEHLTTMQMEKCDDCIYVENSQWCEKCDGEL